MRFLPLFNSLLSLILLYSFSSPVALGQQDESAAETQLDKIIKLEVGDWGEDGHAKSKSVLIRTNFSHKNILAAQAEAIEKIGFSFADEVADEYEDSQISETWEGRLSDVDIQVEYDGEFDREDRSLTVDSYTKVWLELAKLGNPDFKYQIIKADGWIPIGGYGLFY